MEVKIGVAETPREIVVMSNQTPEEIEALVSDALANEHGNLALVDDKGRRIMVPSRRVAYVEIGPGDQRKVGFAVGA